MLACPEISAADIAAFQRDGAVCLRGLFRDWVDVIAAGIERNLRAPGAVRRQCGGRRRAGLLL
ncbi:hypothetical protein JOS77_25985 [Chromobacterium haemolyticum]|nr:hypothetical protein JOS77_25985 [Chromobacterium haemolyticum]